MVQVLEPETTPASIEAMLNYIANTGEKIFTQTGGPGSTDVRSGGAQDPRPVVIRNGRRQDEDFALDRHGFRFVRHATKVGNFFDEEEVRRVYHPEMEALVKAETGASRVVVFDHTLRTADDTLREAKKIREVVPRVHNDYTEWSGPQRVRDLMGAEAERLLERRFAIIQVWRAIADPIRSNPLAMADARSVDPQDLLVAERRYPNRVGQTYRLKYNPAHRWFYFPQMKRDEAIVFKVYDSAKDGRARFTPHTSFQDPATPPGAAPRQSIEARSLAFF